MALELQERQAGARGIPALVAAVDACPLPSLIPALAGQNAEADRYGMLNGEMMQARRAFPRNDVVMGGFAADDATERDDAAMTPGTADKAVGERQAERERDLERARYGKPLIGCLLYTSPSPRDRS